MLINICLKMKWESVKFYLLRDLKSIRIYKNKYLKQLFNNNKFFYYYRFIIKTF